MDGLECKTFFRVSRSVPAGLLETIRSEKATMLLAAWRSEARNRIETNDEAYRMLSRPPVPVVIAGGSIGHFGRVIVVARREDLDAPQELDIDVAADVAARISLHHPVLFVAASVGFTPAPFTARKIHPQPIEMSDPIKWVRDNAKPDDLVVIPGLDTANEALNRVPTLSARAFLVAIGAHGAPAPAHEAHTHGLVVGRSLTEAEAT